MAREERVRAIQALLGQAEAITVELDPWSTETPSQFVAEAVTQCRSEGYGHDQPVEIQYTLGGEKPADQHEAFTGNEEAQEGSRFQCSRQEDDEVAPMSQAADESQQIVEHVSYYDGALRRRRYVCEQAERDFAAGVLLSGLHTASTQTTA